MRLVNLEEFSSLPPGTVFSYWDEKSQTLCIAELYVKGISYDNMDFTCQSLTEIGFEFSDDGMENMDIAEKKLNAGESISLDDDCYGRDGMFDREQRFLVYGNEDIEKMVGLLSKGIR